jgi:hypothetical protein
MQVGQIDEKPSDYVATRDFALNWDDKKMKSVKVRSGETVSYDGAVAQYKDSKTSEEFKGPCHGLKSAIAVMGWLIPKNGKVIVAEATKVQIPRKDFDEKVGGNFETFMAKEQAVVIPRKKYGLIQEKDIVVKDLSKPPVAEEKREGKLEIVGDQVAVKEKLIIRSSTTEVTSSKFNASLIKGDEGSSEGTIPLKMQKKSTEKIKKTFTVDETTPRNISDDLTMDEVQRMKGVIKADDSQDARVIGRVKTSSVDVQQIEGITLKRPVPRQEKPITATVSRGGNEPVVNIQDDGVVVGKIKSKKDVEADALIAAEEKRKKVEASKQARLKAAAATQAALEKEKPVVVSEIENVATVVENQPTASEVIEDTKVETITPGSTDYLSQLPEDWGSMHWVKKEKFIKALTDKGFIEFILSVETIKAVQNACTERLKEIG